MYGSSIASLQADDEVLLIELGALHQRGHANLDRRKCWR
jgi:hypothetical protein